MNWSDLHDEQKQTIRQIIKNTLSDFNEKRGRTLKLADHFSLLEETMIHIEKLNFQVNGNDIKKLLAVFLASHVRVN